MKRILSLLTATVLFFAAAPAQGQTVTPGGLAFVQFNTASNQTNMVSFVVREPIRSGTVVYITNRKWSTSNFATATSNQGTLTLTFNEDVSVGQVIKISFTAGTAPAPTSTVGNVVASGAFDFGPANDIDNLFLYQTGVGGMTFVTGAAYNTAPTGAGVPSGVDYGSNGNSIALGFGNGASVKCGCWTQYTNAASGSGKRTTMVINSSLTNLTSTFYTNAYWISSTTNSVDTKTGMNACTGEGDGVKSSSLTTFMSTSLEYDRYRWGYNNLNQWDKRAAGSGTWVLNSAPSNLTDVTRMADVTFYKDYKVSGTSLTTPNSHAVNFNAAAPDAGTVEFARLRIVDRGAQSGNNVTLTLNPGIVILMHNRVSMEDSNSTAVTGTGKPKMHLLSQTITSGASLGQVYYAQIAPSTAVLNGTYKYSLVINEAGWHHLYSPIKTTLGGVQFVPGAGKAQYSFDYSTDPIAGVQGRNVYRWDAGNTTGSFWQPTTVNDSLSREPHTIFINPNGNHVPMTMVVEGSLRYPDPAQSRQLPAVYSATGLQQGTAGYYSTWLGGTKTGWNFYGNPYLNYIDVAALKNNYATSMSGLSNAVYTWDPTKGGQLNSTNYYTHNGQNGDLQAQSISPFQGFFMQNIASTTSSNGFVVSKKYRAHGNFSSVKRKTNATELSLRLSEVGSNFTQKVYLSENPALAQPGLDDKNDAAAAGGGDCAFGVITSSRLFTIKSVPSILDSSVHTLAVISRKDNQVYQIAQSDDFDPNFESFLYDAKVGSLVNLNYAPYSFTNDSTFKQFRFTWFVVNKNLSVNEQQETRSTYWFTQNDALRIGGSMATDAPAALTLYTWDGRKAASAEGRGNEVNIPTAGLAKGPYVLIVNGKTALKVVVQ
jgi:hypothetical protein